MADFSIVSIKISMPIRMAHWVTFWETECSLIVRQWLSLQKGLRWITGIGSAIVLQTSDEALLTE
jgi:hypothetical protein